MIKSTSSLTATFIRPFRIFTSHYSASPSSASLRIIINQQQQQYRNYNQCTFVRNETTTDSNLLLITEACAKRIKDINAKKGQDRMLRVIVESGGCSGYQVEFSFSKEVEQDDQVFTNSTLPESKVIADSITMSFIKGSTIDFVESMAKTAFVLEKNPNAETGCSCGTSFSVKSKE